MKSKGEGFAQICANAWAEFNTGRKKGDPGMTIKEVNDMLNNLCLKETKTEKAAVLRTFLVQAKEKEVVWIVSIILKDLKHGVSEKIVLAAYHKQTYEAFSHCGDLHKALELLKDRNAELKKNDIDVGDGLILSQLAGRKNTPADVIRWARGKAFAIETKFDGERVQLHRNVDTLGEKCQYWTRNMNDFGPRGYDAIDALFIGNNGLPRKCILDGEIIVYNKKIKEFVGFGTIKSAFIGANWKKTSGKPMPRVSKGFYANPTLKTGEAKQDDEDDGLNDDDDDDDDKGDDDDDKINKNKEEETRLELEWKDFEIVYVPFDILYNDDTSVIHEPLSKRYEILKHAIRGCVNQGSVKVGDTGITCSVVSPFGEQGNKLEDNVSRKFRTVVEENDPNASNKISECLREAQDHGEEGIVVKLLDSPWLPGERGKNWVKMKPDYLETADYDCVIIGGYLGEGKARAGKISQWLLGIIDGEMRNDARPVITTFCKVGTGFSHEEQDILRRKLEPFYQWNRKGVDKGKYTKNYERYQCRQTSGETPDVWITKPEESIVTTVKGDVRLVPSLTFNAPYSLRFPRCVAIRTDKSWNDICTTRDIIDIVEGGKEKLVRGDKIEEDEEGGEYNAFHRNNAAGLQRRNNKQNRNLATSEKFVEHLRPVDIKDVVQMSSIFQGSNFSSIGCDQTKKREVAQFVKERGGKFFESVTSNVNRIVAPPEIDENNVYLKSYDEVLSTEWLFSCKDKMTWPPKAKDWINVSPSVATLYDETIDAFGDAHTSKEDLTEEDVQAMLNQVQKRTRIGTEFKKLDFIDDDDRSEVKKICRATDLSKELQYSKTIESIEKMGEKKTDPVIRATTLAAFARTSSDYFNQLNDA